MNTNSDLETDPYELLHNALARQNPDWAASHVNEQELREFCRVALRNSQEETHFAAKRLRRSVAIRLFEVLRAAIHDDLVKPTRENF